MEVAAPEAVARNPQGLLEEAADGRRIGVAHGVGDAHAVGAGVQQALHHAKDLGRLHFALQRAAECGADAAFDQGPGTRGVPRGPDATQFGDGVIGGLAQVGLAVRLAGGDRQHHQVRTALDRAFGALEVRHQDRCEEAPQGLGIGEDLGRVGHLGKESGRDERADLDLALPGGVRLCDPLALVVGTDDRGDGLQPVAHAYFAYRDLVRIGHGCLLFDVGMDRSLGFS